MPAVALPDVAAHRLTWRRGEAVEQLTQGVTNELGAALGADDLETYVPTRNAGRTVADRFNAVNFEVSL